MAKSGHNSYIILEHVIEKKGWEEAGGGNGEDEICFVVEMVVESGQQTEAHMEMMNEYDEELACAKLMRGNEAENG